MGERNDRAATALLRRLADERERLQRLEVHRTRALANRKLLARKLIRLKVPERKIAAAAGVSGPAVHQWKELADA